MRVGKKLVVVLSVLATGSSTALFFRRDASLVDVQEGTLENPFPQRVERRVLAGAAWAHKIGGPLPAMPGRAHEPLKLPASATASILDPQAARPDVPPVFHKTSVSGGRLLAPLGGVPADEEPSSPAGESFPTEPPQMHTIADGDTLSKIAIRYLGRSERFMEIYELNRDVLRSPDLLPIGATIRIPSRQEKPARPTRPDLETQLDQPRPMVSVRRPD